MGDLIQCNKYEVVLTQRKGSTDFGANARGWRKTRKNNLKFHGLEILKLIYLGPKITKIHIKLIQI